MPPPPSLPSRHARQYRVSRSVYTSFITILFAVAAARGGPLWDPATIRVYHTLGFPVSSFVVAMVAEVWVDFLPSQVCSARVYVWLRFL